MDAFLDFLLSGFTFFGITFQYWMPAFAAIFILWALYLFMKKG